MIRGCECVLSFYIPCLPPCPSLFFHAPLCSRRRPRGSLDVDDAEPPASKRARIQSSSLHVPSQAARHTSSSPFLTSSSPAHKLSLDESPTITSSQPDSFSLSSTSYSHASDMHDNLFAEQHDEDTALPLSPRSGHMNGTHALDHMALAPATLYTNKPATSTYMFGSGYQGAR